jgi:hypothetical protein
MVNLYVENENEKINFHIDKSQLQKFRFSLLTGLIDFVKKNITNMLLEYESFGETVNNYISSIFSLLDNFIISYNKNGVDKYEINYKFIDSMSLMHANFFKLYSFLLVNNIYGIIKFINHSEYSGFHTSGDCLDICIALNIIKPCLDADNLLSINSLFTILQLAIDKHKLIRYG